MSQGMRPGPAGWDTIQNERIHHYKQYRTETSSEEAGQNCLGHNDPPAEVRCHIDNHLQYISFWYDISPIRMQSLIPYAVKDTPMLLRTIQHRRRAIQ